MYTDYVCSLPLGILLHYQHLHIVHLLSKTYALPWFYIEIILTVHLAINRLVFYATWGNIMANIATLISTSGMPDNLLELTPLCEFQGVLIQWFLMSDSLWVCPHHHLYRTLLILL
jgi:hypothetical protein